MKKISENSNIISATGIIGAVLQLILLFVMIQGIILILYYPAGYANLNSYLLPVSHSLGLFLVILFLIPSKPQIRTYFNYRKTPLSIYALVILISITFVIILFPLLIKMSVIHNGMSNFKSTGLSIIIIYGIVLVPLLEEILFRGMFLGDFIKLYSPIKAILYSSILFALIHINPSQMLTAFLGGLFLGFVYYKTNNLLPCIVLHSVINGLSGILFKYCSPNSSYFSDNILLYIIFYLVCLAALIISIIFVVKILSAVEVIKPENVQPV
ncbi:MAG: CPBP family intramembrane metalloprotease [Ignavibacteriaceae bacterium]|jgi:hypothetical protein|nr:CPBP family intramembrane metalloprotease [Ignavibacteriaceae bacterium]